MCENIDKSKYKFSILLPENRKYDREVELLQKNIEVYKLSGVSRKKNLREFKEIIIHKKIDIVHITLGYQAFFYAKAALSTSAEKVIIHSHTSKSGKENQSLVYKLMKKLSFLYYNNTVCKKTINLACSEDAARYMFMKSRKVEIVLNGINVEKFKNEKIDKNIYDNYKINSNDINILTIGRIDTQKNPLFIIKIINELLKLNSNYRLIYVGNGPRENEVISLEKEFGVEKTVNHIASTKEVSKLMKCSDAFLLPSLYEGCPVVLLEAQASNLKCFISNKIDEIVNCGLCKTISLEKSESEWASIIDDEIKNNFKNLKINNDKLNEFTIESTVKKLEEVYG